MADENESFTSIPVHMELRLHQLTRPNPGNLLSRLLLWICICVPALQSDGWLVCAHRNHDNTLS